MEKKQQKKRQRKFNKELKKIQQQNKEEENQKFKNARHKNFKQVYQQKSNVGLSQAQIETQSIKLLQDLFPQCEKDIIEDIFRQKGDDPFQRALEQLSMLFQQEIPQCQSENKDSDSEMKDYYLYQGMEFQESNPNDLEERKSPRQSNLNYSEPYIIEDDQDFDIMMNRIDESQFLRMNSENISLVNSSSMHSQLDSSQNHIKQSNTFDDAFQFLMDLEGQFHEHNENNLKEQMMDEDEFDQKVNKNKKAKKISNGDMQMKKAKTLKQHEQDVFMQFLVDIQLQNFTLLQKKYQLQQLLKDRGVAYEEQKEPLYNQKNNQNGKNGSGQKPQNNHYNGQGYVPIDSKKDFPDLIDEKIIFRKVKDDQVKQRMDKHHHMDFQQRKKFNASNAQQEEQLYRIQDKFKALDHNLIQETYSLLNDAMLVEKLLEIAFPNLMSKQNQYQDNQLERFFKFAQKKQEQIDKKQGHIKSIRDSQNFFTQQILSKFRNINKQKSNANFSQQIYNNNRSLTQQLYDKRKLFLNQARQAQKQGNYQQMEYAQKEAEKYRVLYEQQLQKAQMEIFQIKNNGDTMNWYIDLHGMHCSEAKVILDRRLRQIQVDLDKGLIEPNIDKNNHVLKIVCGKGNHSKGRAVLKFKIPEYLEERNFEIYNFQNDGVVLVRFKTH
ncbi:UNKNOWN [Stylonychia lemnae]|uniref:Smr domain-containing protein n=1 Tax=Stylonychia lemnae TaxID=5949 RepID=A0A078B255_STYLE|nr:UNKNOWN [Stylonychia lemnae]|eukprot:CDW87493.1 UNKNOWN [Stylonychia lemnae]